MGVIVVDVVEPTQQLGTAVGTGPIVTTVIGADSPIATTIVAQSTVETVLPGGTLANVSWGYDFPAAPYEGQVFIKVTP